MSQPPGYEPVEPLRIGMVCPYQWDIPGGVQAHVRDLSETLLAQGHYVSVLAPAEEDSPELPGYVVAAGKSVPIPYNGSIARLQFGVVSAARVRRWLRDGDFDVVHVHEPAPPSLSLLACIIHDGPLVATFHSSVSRSRMLATAEPLLQPFLEKLSARIAVSPAARTMIVENLGADAIVIPNGVAVSHYSGTAALAGYPRARERGVPGGTVGFIGRYDEPRKGMDVLVAALDLLAPELPALRLLLAGRGDAEEFRSRLPRSLRERVRILGPVSETDKARMLHSVDVYCAPNTGGESFGIILLEAMAAGAPVVASDLDAFRRVLSEVAGAPSGILFETGSARALAGALREVLQDGDLRTRLRTTAASVVRRYDWPVIARQVLMVYELAISEPPPAPEPERRDPSEPLSRRARMARAARRIQSS